MLPYLTKIGYQNVMKPLLFMLDPELVHNRMTTFGELLGTIPVARKAFSAVYNSTNKMLEQHLMDIHFAKPIGLAAGFDYEARITQITPSIGFGFHTVGTITNNPYGGNPRPMLGRLPKSRSLMVNKGFKNKGAQVTAEKLAKLHFEIPLGVSIGRTNSPTLTQKESVKDIISALTIFETQKVKHSYYEINISCPNLFGNVTFYTRETLHELLTEVDKLHIKKPIFIKMPINNTNDEIITMLEVISTHSPSAVIFGNLMKDRNNPAILPEEAKKFKVGNFSGKPTYNRSNELIALAYKKYHKRFTIIGCGGVFSPEDAYTKIKKGASLVQLITGMIFQGPQLIYEINTKLPELLKSDGYSHISEAIGVESKS